MQSRPPYPGSPSLTSHVIVAHRDLSTALKMLDEQGNGDRTSVGQKARRARLQADSECSPTWLSRRGLRVETAVASRQGTRKGKSFLGCTLRVIFRVTSSDFAISLPVGVPSNPQPQGRALHDRPCGQMRAHMHVHTHAHTAVHTGWRSHPLHSQWRDGDHVLARLQDGKPQVSDSRSSTSLSFCSGWGSARDGCMRAESGRPGPRLTPAQEGERQGSKEGHLLVCLCSAPKG